MILFISCGNSSKKSYLLPEDDDIKLQVVLERNTKSKHPLDIIIKVTNLSDKTVYYEDTYFPKETRDVVGDYFVVREDNIQVIYKWIMAQRDGTIFIPIQPGKTQINNISLDKLYIVHKGKHHYSITLPLATIQAKNTDGKMEISDIDDLATFPDALGPDEHTSKTISLNINSLDFNTTIHTVRTIPNEG